MNLIGGSKSQGLVVVNLNGKKGIICDQSFNIKTADVVCRNLGYVGAIKSYSKNLLITHLIPIFKAIATHSLFFFSFSLHH